MPECSDEFDMCTNMSLFWLMEIFHAFVDYYNISVKISSACCCWLLLILVFIEGDKTILVDDDDVKDRCGLIRLSNKQMRYNAKGNT